MLKFKDFVPQFHKAAISADAYFEGMKSLMARTNSWIDENRIDVVNVETLVMPVSRKGENVTRETVFTNIQKSMQIVRVWYHG